MTIRNRHRGIISLGAVPPPAPVYILDVTDPTPDQDYVGVANGILEWTFTVPPVDPISMAGIYRYLDDQNYFIAGGYALAFYVYSKIAGVATDIILDTPGFVAGQTYTLRIVVSGTTHLFSRITGGVETAIGSPATLTSPMDAIPTMRWSAPAGIFIVDRMTAR